MRKAEIAIVVRRGGEFLVVHRSPAGGAYWHLVAGGIEPGETAREAAARELEEEVGLRAPVALLCEFEYVPTAEEHAARALARTIAVDCFLVDVLAEWEPTLDHEHDDYRWCSASEADALLYWPEPREAVALAAGLRGAVWIGGSTCAGKTTIADLLGERHRLPVYHVDHYEYEHLARLDATHPAVDFFSGSLDSVWVETPPDALVEKTLAYSERRFPVILRDVAARAPVVAEGFQLHPDRIAPLAERRQAVWLVATDEFRLATHFGRPHAWHTPSKTSDRERAQSNRLERDMRIAAWTRERCAALALKCIEVDGTRSRDEITAEVEAWLAPFLAVDSAGARSS